VQPSIVILTYNSEDSLPLTLASVKELSNDIHIVDSYSQDRTLDIARQNGVQITQHVFNNYGAQRNWAIDNLPLRNEWQLHLDADERISQELAREIAALDETVSQDGCYIPRIVVFMGREIRHGGMAPTWHMRLFRTGKGRCENRLYDQHFHCSGPTIQLRGVMYDDIRLTLSEWTARHNRWANAEVNEMQSADIDGHIAGRFGGNPVEQKRFLRLVYNRAPLFLRAIALFAYRYFGRFGFLDGKEGLIFFVLQTFWFRFLVDAKLYENRKKHKA
jgi:glycosyltransferase involved in cell wall biosynthesis